jgi:hypothetical protein
LESDANEICAAVGGELFIDVGSVGFDGLGTDAQLLRYLLGGESRKGHAVVLA